MADSRIETSSVSVQSPSTSHNNLNNSSTLMPLITSADIQIDNNTRNTNINYNSNSNNNNSTSNNHNSNSSNNNNNNLTSASIMSSSTMSSSSPSSSSSSSSSTVAVATAAATAAVVAASQQMNIISNNIQTSSQLNNMNNIIEHDHGEPEAKRMKKQSPSDSMINNNNTSGGARKNALSSLLNDKLEYRLGGILCCAVCLDLPKTAMYQCQMGHLMCAACFTHLLADGRLRDQVATCPNCRVEISKSTASRNLAVEKAVSELPSECQYCNKEFPCKSVEYHEQSECEERPTNCKFLRIGCQWKGPIHEAIEHEHNCSHPKKSGAEVMSALYLRDSEYSEEKKLFNTLIDLLSYEKIIFNDLQMKPYRTDEYVHKLFYETSRFTAFNHMWVVKSRINNSQKDVHHSNDREITFQLILKSKTTCPLSIHFFALKGPFAEMKVNTQIYKHDFTDQENESEYQILPLPDSAECNRLLAAKAINFRLIMFLLAK